MQHKSQKLVRRKSQGPGFGLNLRSLQTSSFQWVQVILLRRLPKSARSQPSTSGADGVGTRVSYTCVIQSPRTQKLSCTRSFTFLLFRSWYLQRTLLPVRIRKLRSFLPACPHLYRTPGSHSYSGVQLFGCTNLDYEDELRFIRKIWNLYIARKICF